MSSLCDDNAECRMQNYCACGRGGDLSMRSPLGSLDSRDDNVKSKVFQRSSDYCEIRQKIRVPGFAS